MEVAKIDRNYQMSPLEYPNKKKDEITLPHDNLPPYMKVYIWECVELTDEEYAITGEPKNNECVITWLKNNGADPQKDTYVIGNTIGNAPVVSRPNYDFKGWKCPDGRIADKKQNGTVGQPVYIGDTVLGNSFYIAQWKPTKYTVTFNGNGGSPSVMTRKYAYGEQIGYFPTFDKYPNEALGVSGWETENGQSVNEKYVVKSNMTLIAQWKYIGNSDDFIEVVYDSNVDGIEITYDSNDGNIDVIYDSNDDDHIDVVYDSNDGTIAVIYDSNDDDIDIIYDSNDGTIDVIYDSNDDSIDVVYDENE